MSFGGGSPATTTSTIKYTPEQKAVQKAAFPHIQSYLNAGGAKLPSWSRVTPFNEAQTASQNMALNTAFGGLSELADVYKGSAAFLGGPALDPDTNPFLRSAARSATDIPFERLTQEVLPGIRGDAILSGQFGGNAQMQLENQAMTNAQREANAATTRMYSDAYSGGQQRMLQMLGMSDAITGGMLAPTGAVAAVGDQQAGRSQQVLDEQFAQYMYDQMGPFIAAQQALGASMIPGAGTTTTATPAQPSALQQGIGLASMIFGMM